MFKKVIWILGYLVIGLATLAMASDVLLPQVDFVDAQVLDVVRVLAKKTGCNLVIGEDGEGTPIKKVTLHLKNISAIDALQYVLRINGYNFEKNGDTILISTSQQDTLTSLEAVSLKYLSAEKAANFLAKVNPSIISIQGDQGSSLILRGKPTDLSSAVNLIASIDKPSPQILIESKVVEISESGISRLGFNLGTEPTIIKTIKSSTRDELLNNLNWLMGSGQAKVIANPRIATLDNQEAVINIGSRVPFAVPVRDSTGLNGKWSVDYIEAGVKLRIVPRLGEDGYIMTSIQPEVSSISEWKTTPAGDFPVISTRNAQSQVRVKNGETIVVGGLTNETERNNIYKIPLLGHLPIIGLLFQWGTREKEKTEIVFLITPKII